MKKANKLAIAWVLIIIGFVPIIVKVILSIAAGIDYPIQFQIENESVVAIFKEYGVGIIIGSYFAGILMVVIGFMILKKERIIKAANRDASNLDDGETLIHKQTGDNSIITITNKRVRFYGVYVKNLRYSSTNLPDSDKEDFLLTNISKVRPVNFSDVGSNRLAKKNPAKWGIQLQLKDGRIVNLPITEQDIVSGQIEQLINKW